ncbi:MAG: imidazolonepropionase [Chloroflexia bacterium]|nr:imidazolonepropionase [Chloroflexia bacterium]
MMDADLLILHAGQLLTIASAGEPKRGPAMSELGLVEDGAVAIQGERIVAVGPSEPIQRQYRAATVLEAQGQVVLPGFVDPHTHVLFAGDRAGEFELRLRGASYMEIMEAGGGIQSTVNATRSTPHEQLLEQSRARLDHMLAHGTTTAEVKTGYALNKAGELRLLRGILELDQRHPMDLVPTFLGAHAVPKELRDHTEDYVQQVVEEMLPAVAALWAEETASRPRPAPLFCDVFCEKGAFDLAQSRRILERARHLGLALKIHVDEFEALGGTSLAVEMGAISADHLVSTPEEELLALAQSSTVAVALPGTPFGLGQRHYTPARRLIDAGGVLAVASDLNPGTCYCESMPFIIALACRSMRLSPAEAIVAATLNAAHALGLGRHVGSLEVGKQADLLLLQVADYRHLAYRFGTNPVETVVKRGKLLE